MTALADYTAALTDESTTAERWDEIAEALDTESRRVERRPEIAAGLVVYSAISRRRATSLRLTAERQRAEQIGEGFAALEVR